MDGDGEDRPEDVPRLLSAADTSPNHIVFGRRGQRTEALWFRLGYAAYRAIQRVLTGVWINVGNFSVVPPRHLKRLALSSDIWNHYPAAVLNSRLPHRAIALDRGHRFDGRSRLGVRGLMLHGLGAISVFAERIGLRLLVACAVLGFGVVALGGLVVGIRLLTDLAIPGWATFTSGLLAVVFIQLLTLVATFTFGVLNRRASALSIPLRDYTLFVERLATIYEAADPATTARSPRSSQRSGYG